MNAWLVIVQAKPGFEQTLIVDKGKLRVYLWSVGTAGVELRGNRGTQVSVPRDTRWACFPHNIFDLTFGDLSPRCSHVFERQQIKSQELLLFVVVVTRRI